MKRASMVILLISSLIFGGCEDYNEEIKNAKVLKVEASSIRNQSVITLEANNQEMKFAISQGAASKLQIGNRVDVVYSSKYMEIRTIDYSKSKE